MDQKINEDELIVITALIHMMDNLNAEQYGNNNNKNIIAANANIKLRKEELAALKNLPDSQKNSEEIEDIERIIQQTPHENDIDSILKEREAKRLAEEEEAKRIADQKDKEAKRKAEEEEDKRLANLKAEAEREAQLKAKQEEEAKTIQSVLDTKYSNLYEGIKAVKKLNKLVGALQTETLEFFYKDENIDTDDQESLNNAIDSIRVSDFLNIDDFNEDITKEVKKMLSDLEVYNTPELKNLFNKLILSMNGLAGAFVKIWDSPKIQQTEQNSEVPYDNDIKDATIQVDYDEKNYN